MPDPRPVTPPDPSVYIPGRVRIGTCGDGEPYPEQDDDD
jgi:hypothetical protein